MEIKATVDRIEGELAVLLLRGDEKTRRLSATSIIDIHEKRGDSDEIIPRLRSPHHSLASKSPGLPPSVAAGYRSR